MLRVSVAVALALLLGMLAVAQGQPTYTDEALQLTVYGDGVVHVRHVLGVNASVPSISVPLLATRVGNVLVLDEASQPLSYQFAAPTISIATLGAVRVTLEYDTGDLTSKQSGVWTLRFTAPTGTVVELPRGGELIFSSAPPDDVQPSARGATVRIGPGSWELSYVLPLIIPAPPPTTTVTVPPPGGPPQPGQQPSTGPGADVVAAPGGLTPLLAAGGIGLAAVLGALVWWRRRRGAPAGAALRPEDQAVLAYLRERGGRAVEAEIRRQFVLPKTSTWRLVKRLERLGLVQIVRVGVQNEVHLVTSKAVQEAA